MSTLRPYRVPKWQDELIKKLDKKKGVGFSDLSRFALNCVFLKYGLEIDQQMMDIVEFKAKKKFAFRAAKSYLKPPDKKKKPVRK